MQRCSCLPSQLCCQAPASAEGERSNPEKLSYFLFNTQRFRLTAPSVQDTIPFSRLPRSKAVLVLGRGHECGLWPSLVRAIVHLAGAGCCPLSPGQSSLSQVPTPRLLLSICGLLPASSPRGHILEHQERFPSHGECWHLGWWVLWRWQWHIPSLGVLHCGLPLCLSRPTAPEPSSHEFPAPTLTLPRSQLGLGSIPWRHKVV